MSFDAYLVIAILIIAVLLFSFEWIEPDVVAVLVLASFVATGILSPEEAFSGFSSNAVIAIGALLIIGAGLVRSGAVKWMAERVSVLAGSNFKRLMLVSTLLPGILSGFINIIAAVSIFIPAVLRLSRRSGFGAGRLLLPMAVSGLLGANLSLIGASHNLVVNNLLQQATKESFGFFEFMPIGAVLLFGITVYSLLLSSILLKSEDRSSMQDGRDTINNVIETYHLNERLWEILVQPDSAACCRSLKEISPGKRYGLGVLMVLRRNQQLPVESRDFSIQADDVLALSGSRKRIESFIQDQEGLVLMGQPEAEKDFTWSAFDLIEVVVPPRSELIGNTLREAGLRRKTGLTGIALWREDRPYRSGARDRKLKPGDGILLFGGRDHVRDFRPEPDLLWLKKPREQEAPIHLRKFAPVATLIFLAVIAASALNWLPIAVAALIGAASMILLGILTPGQAYRNVDWRTLILIGGMYPVGTAIQNTGVAEVFADLIIRSFGVWGTVPALAGVGLLALLLTQPMHNAVAALIVTPVALQVAQSMDASLKAFAVAVVVGASASFIMPVGHPAPLLVREPGNYRNMDYLKFGLGAAVFVLAVIGLVVPLLWPL